MGIVVETTHPVKFYDVVEPVIGATVSIPGMVQEQIKKKKMSTLIENDPPALIDFLRLL